MLWFDDECIGSRESGLVRASSTNDARNLINRPEQPALTLYIGCTCTEEAISSEDSFHDAPELLTCLGFCHTHTCLLRGTQYDSTVTRLKWM